jgi:hypothetical protein
MTKSLMKLMFVAFGLALCSSTAAYGLAFGPIQIDGPEIDAGLAVSALTLLAGTLAVLRARRKQ